MVGPPGPPGHDPIGWDLAERVAIRVGGREPFADSYHSDSLIPDFDELTAEAEILVTRETGLVSAAGPARARVTDRAGWVRANLASFRRLLGPLTEVTASTHRWEELAPHLGTPQAAAYVAQERVLRGENLIGDERSHPEILELPLELLGWEPTYALATYRSDHVEVAEPWEPRASLSDAEVAPATEMQDEEIENVLLDLVSPWVNESNGAARAVMVSGDAVGAASHLAFSALRTGPLDRAEAMQRLAWGAASGGAHGRRRGAAYGRFAAWYTISVLCGYDWPVVSDDLQETSARLNWFLWDEGATEEGWALRLAVEDPTDGWAAAIAATDVLPET